MPLTVTVLAIALGAGLLAAPCAAGEPAETGLSQVTPAAPGGPLYGLQYNGLFISGDQGGHWLAASHGLEGHYLLQLAVDPLVPTVAYVGTNEAGVFGTRDAGATWVRWRGVPASGVSCLATSARVSGLVYAVVGGAQTVYRSVDSGARWKRMGALPQFDSCQDLQVDRTNASRLVALTYQNVRTSNDAGRTWHAASGLPVQLSGGLPTLASDPRHPQVLYVSGTHSVDLGDPLLYRSVDGGQTWRPTGLRVASRRGEFVRSVGVTLAGTVLAFVEHRGLLRSTDRGESFVSTSGLPPGEQTPSPGPTVDVQWISFAPRGGTLFAAVNSPTSGAPLLVSHDDGASWAAPAP